VAVFIYLFQYCVVPVGSAMEHAIRRILLTVFWILWVWFWPWLFAFEEVYKHYQILESICFCV